MASAVVGALLAVPAVRYLLYPVTAQSDESEWATLGSVASLTNLSAPLRRTLDLKQRDGWRETTSQPVVYAITVAGKLQVLSAICPHLGCTVPWDPAQNQFVCPCHGGTFSATGARISGPPRRALDSLTTKVSGGTVMVKYQNFRSDAPNKEVIS